MFQVIATSLVYNMVMTVIKHVYDNSAQKQDFLSGGWRFRNVANNFHMCWKL